MKKNIIFLNPSTKTGIVRITGKINCFFLILFILTFFSYAYAEPVLIRVKLYEGPKVVIKGRNLLV